MDPLGGGGGGVSLYTDAFQWWIRRGMYTDAFQWCIYGVGVSLYTYAFQWCIRRGMYTDAFQWWIYGVGWACIQTPSSDGFTGEGGGWGLVYRRLLVKDPRGGGGGGGLYTDTFQWWIHSGGGFVCRCLPVMDPLGWGWGLVYRRLPVMDTRGWACIQTPSSDGSTGRGWWGGGGCIYLLYYLARDWLSLYTNR